MTGYDLQRALDALGLSQRDGAKFLRYNERSLRKWVADKNRVPAVVAMLLRLMVRDQVRPDDVPEP